MVESPMSGYYWFYLETIEPSQDVCALRVPTAAVPIAVRSVKMSTSRNGLLIAAS
jgi:hypothetical protein